MKKYTIKLSSLSTQTPPKSAAPALTMASSLSEADITNIAAKFTLREDDIDRIVARVRDSVMDNLKIQITSLLSDLIKPLKEDLQQTKQALKEKITENEKLKSDISELKLAVDEQEQYSRRSCLRINGVIGDEGDPAENVESKILNLAQAHHIDVTSNDIDVAHRLGKPRPGYTRAVLVKFTNLKARHRVMAAKKTLGPVYINEDLTRFRQSLHYHARQLAREKKIERTWIAGGKVLCSVSSGTSGGIRFHIRSMDDIENLSKNNPSR